MPRLTKIVGIVLIMFVCTIGTLIGREEKEKTRYVLPPELEKFLTLSHFTRNFLT